MFLAFSVMKKQWFNAPEPQLSEAVALLALTLTTGTTRYYLQKTNALYNVIHFIITLIIKYFRSTIIWTH